MDANGEWRRRRVPAFLSAETKLKEGPTLNRRISEKAADSEGPGADTKGSPWSKTGNAPRIAPAASGREGEPRTDSWKDSIVEAGEFSSTWTDPEPFITLDRHVQKNCSDDFPECISNTYENNDLPLPASTCTASHAAPVYLEPGEHTSLFEPHSSHSSQPALGEASPDTLSSTWIELEDLGTELDDAGSDDECGKTDTVTSETEQHSEKDTGLGSLESSPGEKAKGDSDDDDDDEEEEEHPSGQDDFEEDFDGSMDDMNDDDSDDDELPSLQEIYERCQAIRTKRFSGDLYNIWRQKQQEEAKEDAVKILAASGFCPADPDEVGEDIDAGLSLVPDRFWQQESKANEISVEELKAILEEKKDAESRRQFQEYCASVDREHRSTRRSAIIGGGGGSSSLLNNYLKMKLISHRVPMYYFPSYLRRYQTAMQLLNDDDDDDESDKESNSS